VLAVTLVHHYASQSSCERDRRDHLRRDLLGVGDELHGLIGQRDSDRLPRLQTALQHLHGRQVPPAVVEVRVGCRAV
jgi:hypothetical protein